MKKLMIAAALAATLSAPAFAQVRLDNTVYAEKAVATGAGFRETVLEKAQRVSPGQVAVYVLTYQNAGKRPASNLTIKNKVPADVSYVGAGDGQQPDLSVDGGRTFGALDALKVTGPDGAQRAAQYADVNYVRWTIQGPVAPGSKGAVSYRGRVR